LQRREYRSVADDLKSLDDVSLTDIAGVLKKYPLSRYTAIAIGPRTDVRQPQQR
jgi:hypothetical protein